jgi:LacI family transcriptional regulator
MTDIAREAGVSKNTVSLALRNDAQISQNTRERIHRIAKKLGYRKNPTVARLMAQLRAFQSPSYRAPLALLNANADAEALERHPTLPTYVSGCRRRASELGYSFDDFWLPDPALDDERLGGILRARGIAGAIVIGLMHDNRLPSRFGGIWSRFPCVVTGVRTLDPALSFASVDHHMLALTAFEKALELGYRRPALVLDRAIDELVNGRFTAGTLIAQRCLPLNRRTRPFHDVAAAREDRSLFHRWLERERPDVMLTLYHEVRRWLGDLGKLVPRDMGLIQLEWRRDHPDWAGMDQHNDIAGAVAVDMLIGMIHGNETGIPAFPRGTLIGSTWVDGATVVRARG